MKALIQPKRGRVRIPRKLMQADERIVLAHGGGGELTANLIRHRFLPHLHNSALSLLSDSAVLPWSSRQVVFTTDSYVVTPLEFPGGDIGRLAVAGTVNDLAVMGARPMALSLGLILEEGLHVERLDRIITSIANACEEAGVEVVTGDTKVIERRGAEDSMFINTSGIGWLREGVHPDMARIKPGDAVIVSGTIADHGLTIISLRSGMEFDSDLKSDTAPLNGLIAEMLSTGTGIRFMRDATRGGLAGVLTDVSESCSLSIQIAEAQVPISRTARHAAEMLGLDPLNVANEGKIVCFVENRDADRLIATMRRHPLGHHAAIIGHVTDAQPPLVELNTVVGGQRIVQRPYGEDLPRIC